MGLYVVANVDGHVISSVDGLEWSEAFDAGISIGKVAVGPSRIVYTRCDVEKEMDVQPGLYHTAAWNVAPVLASGTEVAFYNEVHYLGGRFVAVGYSGSSPKVPAFAYSSDGVNWTIGQVDPGYALIVGGGNDMQFNDVGYNGEGYFIISKVDGEGLAGGFYVSDLSVGLDESNFVTPENFPVDANQLVFTEMSGGENFGAWSAFSDDGKTWWSTFDIDPAQPWNFINGWDLTQAFRAGTGLESLQIMEAAVGMLSGYVTWMLSTSNGQIVWWPHVPAGPFVSVPGPYEATVDSVGSLNPLEVQMSSGLQLPQDGERVRIEGSSGLMIDGHYFVESLGSGNYRLYSDLDRLNPVDASALSGSYVVGSAVAKMSRGVFIDALGYGDGKFFAGNDDEEVFLCSSISEESLVWTKVDDKNNVFSFWNDVSYGEFNGCSTSYTYDFSPDEDERINSNWRYASEGNLDTAVITGPGGKRTSVQRTGYFDYLDSCGNRKSVYVRDGDTVTDEPEVPVVYTNPAGNPMVNPDTGSTV